MRYAFFGTPRFAAIILEELIKAGMPPALVVTNPDRPAGRKKIMTSPPAKLVAQSAGIPVWQPEKLDSAAEELKGDWDFFVVAAYAKILKDNILAKPRHGTLGIHPSLLPKYRGASPIQSAILAGEPETGVAIYILDEAVDHGPVLAQTKLELNPETDYLELEELLARAGGRLLAEAAPKYLDGEIKPVPQNHAEATFTKKFETTDGFVDLTKDAPEIIYRKIKALNPEPGVYAIINSIRTKLLDAKLADGKIQITKIQEAGSTPKEANLML
jgi:methionyl-tRNA formyltransferase